MIIERTSDDCVQLRSGVRGKLINLNMSLDEFALLREPPTSEMIDLMARFREAQCAWLLRLLTAKSSEIDGGKAKQDGILGVSNYMYHRGSGLRFLRFNQMGERPCRLT